MATGNQSRRHLVSEGEGAKETIRLDATRTATTSPSLSVRRSSGGCSIRAPADTTLARQPTNSRNGSGPALVDSARRRRQLASFIVTAGRQFQIESGALAPHRETSARPWRSSSSRSAANAPQTSALAGHLQERSPTPSWATTTAARLDIAKIHRDTPTTSWPHESAIRNPARRVLQRPAQVRRRAQTRR